MLRQIYAPVEVSQATYGSPIADKHLVLFEGLLDGGDITIIQGRDRKYAIIPEENFPALAPVETPRQVRGACSAYEGSVENAYVRTWEALNWVRFYVKSLPDRLRRSETEFRATGIVDFELIEELRNELKERLGDVICKFADLNHAAALKPRNQNQGPNRGRKMKNAPT